MWEGKFLYQCQKCTFSNLEFCSFQFEIQTWIAVDRLKQPVAFQDRDVDDMRDGYVNFDSLHHKYVTVMRKRTDVAIQVMPLFAVSGRVIN